MQYFVYILKSLTDKSYYIGVTNNISRRLKGHNTKQSKFTKSKTPYILMYKEIYKDIKVAYSREKYLKKLKKRKYIERLIAIKTVSPDA